MADDKKIIFSMVGVSKNFGPQKRVLNNIYLSFFYGAKIGIIGLNGAGKSTLMKIIAGVEKDYDGQVVFSPGYSVGYLEQEPKLDPNKTVRECVQEGVQPVMDLLREYDEINNAFADPEADYDKLLARQAELQDKLDATDAWNIDSKLDRAMDALRCPDDDALVQNLSGGEKRRAALAGVLAMEPDVLLADEPTAGLDPAGLQSVVECLQALNRAGKTIVMVSHEPEILARCCSRLIVLEEGRIRDSGTPSEVFGRNEEFRPREIRLPRALSPEL